MSDRDVLTLIERAAHDAPRMRVAPEAVLAGGRSRVRRRRTAAAGMTLGGLALTGALWLGLGGPGVLGSAPQPSPAQTTWEVTREETVELPGEFTFSDGVHIGDAVLRTRVGGGSSLEITVDDETVSAPGEGIVGDRAVAYDAGEVSVVVYPAVRRTSSVLIGAVGESTGHTDPVQVGGSDVVWSVVRHAAGTAAGVEDVLYLGGDSAQMLSGQPAFQAHVAPGLQIWSVPGADRWGSRADWGGAQPARGDQLSIFGSDGLE